MKYALRFEDQAIWLYDPRYPEEYVAEGKKLLVKELL